MTSPSAVLLDIDGTLLLSNDAHARAWADVLAELGLPKGFDEARVLIGMGGDKVLPRLTGLDADSDEGRRVLERRGEIFRERWLDDVRPVPGVRPLLERMRSAGMTLVVATSAGDDDLDPLLERSGVADLIEAATGADDAEDSKPDPDIVTAALARSGEPPERVLMMGDTPYDVEAARRAGVGIVGVKSGGWSEGALDGALAVYDDCAHVLRAWDGSPFGAGPRGRRTGG